MMRHAHLIMAFAWAVVAAVMHTSGDAGMLVLAVVGMLTNLVAYLFLRRFI